MTRKQLEKLEKRPRPERIRALWYAMKPTSRTRIWTMLNEGERASLVTVMFDATEET